MGCRCTFLRASTTEHSRNHFCMNMPRRALHVSRGRSAAWPLDTYVWPGTCPVAFQQPVSDALHRRMFAVHIAGSASLFSKRHFVLPKSDEGRMQHSWRRNRARVFGANSFPIVCHRAFFVRTHTARTGSVAVSGFRLAGHWLWVPAEVRLKPQSLRSDIIGSVLRQALLSLKTHQRKLKIQAQEDKDAFLRPNKRLRKSRSSAETRSVKSKH